MSAPADFCRKNGRLRLGLVAQRTALVGLNIPPATVYHLARREETA